MTQVISARRVLVAAVLASGVATAYCSKPSSAPAGAAAPRITMTGPRGAPSVTAKGGTLKPEDLPTPTSKEVLAIDAYLTWLARGTPVGKSPSWRGQNTIAAAKLVPIEKLDPHKGETIYAERCTSCHGADGQGVVIGDKKAGPLWGPNSWNDGAGAARVYTLAGMIRYTMPYLSPGSLTDEEAQQVAAFITSKPRPVYPYKNRDYSGSKIPSDAVYYRTDEAKK